MIIKLDTGYGLSGEERWKFIDNVRGLETERATRKNLQERDTETCIWHEAFTITSAPEDKYLVLSFYDERAYHVVIITNCPTYLLNDAGKTIERLG